MLRDGSLTKIGEEVAGGFFDWVFGHVEIGISTLKDLLFPKKSYAN